MPKTYTTVQGDMVGKHSLRLCKGVSLPGVKRRGFACAKPGNSGGRQRL